MNGFLLDLRLALRTLRRSPGFTLTAVLILALGIGMATAMFTVFQRVVLTTLPARAPDRVVKLWTYRGAHVEMAVSESELEALERESRTLRGVAGVVHYGAYEEPLMEGDRQLHLRQANVTPNFFDVLGVRPALGRLFRSEDSGPSGPRAAVISYSAWQRDFGGDARILGRRLTLPTFGLEMPIVGVAPPGLDLPTGADYWLPEGHGTGEGVGFDAVARLAPGATAGAARAEFLSLVQRLDRQRQIPLDPAGAEVETLQRAVLGNAQPILFALAAAVGLLLLIACVNVGNLLLLRATLRTRELVIRRALGGSYREIARLLGVESLVLAALGGGLGLALAAALLRLFGALAPQGVPRMDLVRASGLPLGAAAAVTTFAVLLFGTGPALLAARGNVATALRHDARSGSETRGRRSLRRALIAAQVALALLLLSGAGLLVRSLERLEHVPLGYDPRRVALFEVTVPYAKIGSQPRYAAMLDELIPRLRALPGVASVTPILIPPFLGANVWHVTLQLPGQTRDQARANPSVPVEVGGDEYFHTWRIPLMRGRAFTAADRDSAPRVAVVSQALAREYWSGRNPIGQRFRLPGDSADWRTVVGVAGDIRYRSLRDANATLYLPWRQSFVQTFFAIRTGGDPGPVEAAVRREIRAFDPTLDVWHAGTMDDYLARPLAQPRLSALLLAAFALTALLLAAIGLYGVMASTVREQTRDLGIRMALGARPERLRGDVLRDALRVVGVGGAVGLVAAIVATRSLEALLYQVSPADPLTLGGVCLLLLAVALLAAYLPARRATRVDPVEALRAE